MIIFHKFRRLFQPFLNICFPACHHPSISVSESVQRLYVAKEVNHPFPEAGPVFCDCLPVDGKLFYQHAIL